jgi:hypothetical protein
MKFGILHRKRLTKFGIFKEMAEEKKTIEIRGFLQLDAFLRKKFGTMPIFYDIDGPITGLELSRELGIKREDIEVIFVNGFVQEVNYVIHPGDRMAFLPPGCPGPYRIALGFYGKNQGNSANFKIKKEDRQQEGEKP